MGKWATYRRRGGGQGATALPAPPAPVILATDNGDNTFLVAIVTPASGAGVATVEIFENGSDLGAQPFGNFPITTAAFSGATTYQLALNGDGITYSGQSPLSNVSP